MVAKRWYAISIVRIFLIMAALIVLSLVTNGCAIVSHGRIAKITYRHVDSIKVGVSTKEDIIELLGKPQKIVYKPNDIEVFVYSHGVERSIAIPFILSWGRVGGTGQTLTVTFQSGRVTDYEFITDERGIVE